MKQTLLLLALLPFLAHAQNQLRIVAQIDGASRLVIKTNGIHWEHIEAARPGKTSEPETPTRIGAFVWYPIWPTEGRDGPGASSTFEAAIRFTGQVSMLSSTARGTVSIIQQPTEGNDQTLTIDFNDIFRPGSAIYEVVLSNLIIAREVKLQINVSQITLSWPSELGQSYQLQTASHADGPWIDVGAAIVGTGETISIPEGVENVARIYRLILK